MSKSRIFPLALAALTLGSVLGSSGCDTLKARARAQKGVEKYRNGDIKGAAQLFTEAAEIDPTFPPIIINRGYTHLALYQQFARSKEGQEAANVAVASFKQYMNMPGLKPDQKQRARDYLLQTFVDARRYDDAVEYFKPQVERDNPDIEALTILGNIAKSIGKMDASRYWLERRIKANPTDTDGYVALAIMTWDDLCADSQCRTPPAERRNNLTMPSADRIAKANGALELLDQARALSPKAPTPVTYANLILRERSYAQPNDELKRLDLEEATKLLQLAVAMQKAATGAAGAAAAAAAGAPAPEAAKPDGGTAPADAGAKAAPTPAAAPAAPTAATPAAAKPAPAAPAPAAPTPAAPTPAAPTPAPVPATPPAPTIVPAAPAPAPVKRHRSHAPAAAPAAPAGDPAAPAAAPAEPAAPAAPAPAAETKPADTANEKKPAESTPPPPPKESAGAAQPAAPEKQ